MSVSVLKKLTQARLELAKSDLKKTGENRHVGYKYFELGDFLPTAQAIFAELGLCGIVSFTIETATLTITDTEDGSSVQITSPMGSAALRGCHEVQNIGAVETYQRRYLWVAAFEIVEHDVLDATTGKSTKNTGRPTSGVWEAQSEESQAFLLKIAGEVAERMSDPTDALDHIESQSLDSDEKVALWTRFDSKTRTALKKAQKAKEPA